MKRRIFFGFWKKQGMKNRFADWINQLWK